MQENTAYKILSFSNSGSLFFHLPRSHTSVFLYPHFFPVFFSFFFLYCFLPCCHYFLCCFLAYQNIFFCISLPPFSAYNMSDFSAIAMKNSFQRSNRRELCIFYIFLRIPFLLLHSKSGILILKPSKTIKKGSKLNHEWS